MERTYIVKVEIMDEGDSKCDDTSETGSNCSVNMRNIWWVRGIRILHTKIDSAVGYAAPVLAGFAIFLLSLVILPRFNPAFKTIISVSMALFAFLVAITCTPRFIEKKLDNNFIGFINRSVKPLALAMGI